MLNNKADFVLEYQEQTSKSLKRDDVDWSQSRVIFIAPQFSTYQKQSIEFKDLPFELWEIHKYSNDTIALSQHKSSSQESIQSIVSNDDRAEQINKAIKVYSEDDHLRKGNPEIQELYAELKERLFAIDNFEVNPLKFWINFKLNKKWVLDMDIQKKGIKIHVNLKKGLLDDPKGIFRDVAGIGHFGYGDYEYVVTPNSDLDYLMSCVKQSYNFHMKSNG